jgi:hypothetical protein
LFSASAAVLLGDVHGVQVGLGQPVVRGPGKLRGLIHLGRVRGDLVVGQRAD